MVTTTNKKRKPGTVKPLLPIFVIVLITLLPSMLVIALFSMQKINETAVPATKDSLTILKPHGGIIGKTRNTIHGWDYESNPLSIPPGQPPNLPSIRIQNKTEEATTTLNRKLYGGKGDAQHLGGFTDFDINGISPAVWRNMLTKYGIKSVLDVGCGRGISTLWFHLHGVDILCVEGSHDAIEKSVLPNVPKQVVEHDYSRGPWWPAKTYDAVWSVEFLE